MPSKSKKSIKSDVALGNVSEIGEGISIFSDIASGETIVATNIMGSNVTDVLDTYGIGNLDYKKHKEMIDKNAPLIENAQGNLVPAEISIDVQLEQGKDKVIIKGKDITKAHVIEGLKKPKILRTPRVLLLDDNISDKEAQKVIVAVNNEIITKNDEEKRADTLNIITVPRSEWNRRAIIGEVEKSVFGTFGKGGKESKRLGITIKDEEIKLRKLKEQLNLLNTMKNSNPIEQQKILDKIKKLETTKLPKQVRVYHPYEKIKKMDNTFGNREILIEDIDYDLLYDNTILSNSNESAHGTDFRKLFVKGGTAYIEVGKDEYDKNELKQLNAIERADKTYIPFDLNNEVTFKPKVLEQILEFQPSLTDQRLPPYDQGKFKGTSTARIGQDPSNKPNLSNNFEAMFLNPNNTNLQQFLQNNPEEEIKFRAYVEQLKRHENTLKITPPIRCQAGAIPVLRKWSPNAFGMTKKQKVCDTGLAYNRLKIIDERTAIEKKNFIKELENEGTLANYSDTAIEYEANKRARKALNNDIDYRKIVGCDTQQEYDKAEAIEATNEENIALAQLESEETGEKVSPELIPPYRVPMRFPVPEGMGDIMYCKSYKNTVPNIKYTFNPLVADKWAKGEFDTTELSEEKQAMFGIPTKVKALDEPFIFMRKSSRDKDKKHLLLKEDIDDLNQELV